MDSTVVFGNMNPIYLISFLLLNLSLTPNLSYGKIQELDHTVYCGPRGGYGSEGKYKFPIKTRRQAIAALSYRYWAPNPAGIKECVCEHFPNLPSCSK